MPEYIKHVESTPGENKTLTRGYFVDKSTLELSFDPEPTQYDFGKSPKDIIEFTVYSATGEFLGWKLVDDEPNFEKVQLEYTNYTGDYVTGQTRIFVQNYPTIDGKVLVSPSTDMKSFDFDSGNYLIRYAFRNDIVGSHANKSKLVIQEISPTRTEIKIVPECLKTSKNPSDISLNVEYENFLNKRLPVSQLYGFMDGMLKTDNIQSTEFIDGFRGLLSDYDEQIRQAIEVQGGGVESDIYTIAKTIKEKVYDLYRNVIISKYTSVFSRSDYMIEYINCINYVISTHPRLGDSDVGDLVLNLYRSILVSLFDSDYLDTLYVDRFDMYLNNLVNLGNSQNYPIISYALTTENLDDSEKHIPIVIKLLDPLPMSISVGQKFYISNRLYSDDVMQKTLFFKKVQSTLFKLRGPDTSWITSASGTKPHIKDDLVDELGHDEVDSVISDLSSYFNKNINRTNSDFSEFKNFVKFSSAKKQVDIFIQKFSKLSKLITQISAHEYTIEKLEKKIEDNLIDPSDANDAIGVLRRIDLDKKKKELNDELFVLSDYEKFLFYQDDPNSFPRNDFIYIQGCSGETRLANGRYVASGNFNDRDFYEHHFGGWYLWWDPTAYAWVLSSSKHIKLSNWIEFKNESYYFETKVSDCNSAGFLETDTIVSGRETIRHGPETGKVAPEYIQDNISEWKQSRGFAWYQTTASDAMYYDRTNDDNLTLNIPEFLIRTEENSDFTDFLNVVGMHFDTLNQYIENMGNSRRIRNDRTKGIPDDLIYYFLKSFGINFAGQENASDSPNLLNIQDENSVQFRRNVVWRRILNNLPYIVKAKGTEASLNALLKCYGVPEHLFMLREYGGANYEDESSEPATFSFNTFDYKLEIENEDEYVEVPWAYDDVTPTTLEFKIILRKSKRKEKHQIIIVDSTDWELGVEYRPSYGVGYGRFYFKSEDEFRYIPDETKNPIYIPHDTGYDILIQRSDTYDTLSRQVISVTLKRRVDEDIAYTETQDMLVSLETYIGFSNPREIYIGNHQESNFNGLLDRLRIYTQPIEEESFETHILFSQSYGLDSPTNLSKSLVFKTNFDYPHDISEITNYDKGYGIIPNSAFGDGLELYCRCYNFRKIEYPYNYVGNYKKEFARLPLFSSQVFNNTKIRLESQELISPLTPYARSTKKSLDRTAVDTNKLGLFFGPGVAINEEILKFFGNFKLGDYIGSPDEYGKSKYEKLEHLRKLFFKEGFGRVDWYNYLNILKTYLDSSLFENLEKLLPARTTTVAGLLIEPTLLERPKFKGTGVTNEIQSNVGRVTIIEPTEKIKPLKNIHISARPRNKNIMSFANEYAFTDKKLDENVVCMTSNFNYRKVHGTTYDRSLFENIDYSDYKRVCSTYGHYFIDGKQFRVETSKDTCASVHGYTSGLIDTTLHDEVYIDVKLTDTEELTQKESGYFSTAEGRFISKRNLNRKRVFSNTANTWFIYYEPYISEWVLINADPRKVADTSLLLTDGSNRRLYGEVSVGSEYPRSFGINAYDEIRYKRLSGNFETWDAMFKNDDESEKLTRYTIYSAEASVIIKNDKFMQLSGDVIGIVECEVTGYFTGDYSIISYNDQNEKEVTKHRGSVRFDGHPRHLRLNGNFRGTLSNGTVGNVHTNSAFILKNGMYNNDRYGGCYFENKQMFGDINDIVADDLKYTKLDLSIYDSSKLNTQTRDFKNLKLIPTPDVVTESVKYKIPVNKKLVIERNSTNNIYYTGINAYRKTIGKYKNVFYHDTRNEIVPPILHDISTTLSVDIETSEIRSLKLIAFSNILIGNENNPDNSYNIKYSATVERETIHITGAFVYNTITGMYDYDYVINQPGIGLSQNKLYRIYDVALGEQSMVGDVDDIQRAYNSIYKERDGAEFLDMPRRGYTYAQTEASVRKQLEAGGCSIIATQLINSTDPFEGWAYFVCEFNETQSREFKTHSYNYIKNVEYKTDHTLPKNYVSDIDDGLGKHQISKLFVKYNPHEIISNNLRGGDDIALEVRATKKLNYSLQVNRELTPGEGDDSEAVIYTRDTLPCTTTFNIHDKFLKYRAELQPIYNQSYHPPESQSYFLLMGTSMYQGFEISGFSGRWITANGRYVTSYRKNKKLTYIHTSNKWVVFWATDTPRCNKTDAQGAWVLLKIGDDSFFEKLESELYTPSALWMYGFVDSQFNSEVTYTSNIEINANTFSTDYGSGPNDTDLKYEASVSMIRDLCTDSDFIKNEIRYGEKSYVDTSFTIIPNLPAFEIADEFASNSLGVINGILAWSLHIKSVASKLPNRGLYDKIFPNPDSDIKLEVEYDKTFERVIPVVKVIGPNVGVTEYRRAEGEYYTTNLEIHKYPVYRNANGFFMWRDVQRTGTTSEYVWVIAEDSQSLATKTSDLLNKQRLVFTSSRGSCVDDDFNFRLGYDIEPNVRSTVDRNITLADAFSDAILSESSTETIQWGYRRDESTCSVCEDTSTAVYGITVSPDNLHSQHAGKLDSIRGSTSLRGVVRAEIECNKLDCNDGASNHYGVYDKVDGRLQYEKYVNNNKLIISKDSNSLGWRIKWETNADNINSERVYVSSNSPNVPKEKQYPKYGKYVSITNEVANIRYIKDRYSVVKILVSTREDKISNEFIRVTGLKNGRMIFENDAGWYVFYNIEEFSKDEYWCISDSLSDRNIKYKADHRLLDESKSPEDTIDFDEEFGVYYIEEYGTIDYSESTTLVANMIVDFDVGGSSTLELFDLYDSDTFEYRISYNSNAPTESSAFEVIPIMSHSQTDFSTVLPVEFDYSPEIFFKDFNDLVSVGIKTDGILSANSTKIDVDLRTLWDVKTETLDVAIKNQYKKLLNKFSSQVSMEVSDYLPDHINKVKTNLSIDVISRRDRIQIHKNIHRIVQISEFEEEFRDSGHETERTLYVPYEERLEYEVSKKYDLYDSERIKIDGDVIPTGRQRKSRGRRIFHRNSTNRVSTTINAKGICDQTSPIIRTRAVYARNKYDSGSFDSFWFIDDETISESPQPDPVPVRNSISDLPDSVTDKLEFYYSFNNSRKIRMPHTPTPTNTQTPTNTATPTSTETETPTEN